MLDRIQRDPTAHGLCQKAKQNCEMFILLISISSYG